MIHSSASVSSACVLAPDVEVGPHCVLTGHVELGRGVRLIGNVSISGPAKIGEGTVMYPFACVGFPGQDFKFKVGDPTAGVVIGKNAILRESATVHAATKMDRPTTVGDNVLMMCGAHVGHDAWADHRAIMVNGAALGGHSYLGQSATLSAYSALHQFGRVGRLAFVSASVAIPNDIPPFCLVAQRNELAGLNLIGLRRNGMAPADITQLRSAFRDVLRKSMTADERLAMLEERGRSCSPVREWFDFFNTKKRAIATGVRASSMEMADSE